MTTSARNAFRGIVHCTDGAVNAEVTLRIAENVHITAIVTRQSIGDLALVPGKEAIALIKASFVILAIGFGPPHAINSTERLQNVPTVPSVPKLQ